MCSTTAPSPRRLWTSTTDCGPVSWPIPSSPWEIPHFGESPFDGILAGFNDRDRILAGVGGFDAVTLWFEHDLYDQLQIAEILSRLAAPFMGDLWVLKELAGLCSAPTPYLEAIPGRDGPLHGPETSYALTGAGQKALSGELHWADVNDYDLWRGGSHLAGERVWYWDAHAEGFVDRR